LAPEQAAQAANDPVPTDKKKETRKHASKQVVAAEPGPLAPADKKVKPDARWFLWWRQPRGMVPDS
jgi:hypothetical protein